MLSHPFSQQETKTRIGTSESDTDAIYIVWKRLLLVCHKPHTFYSFSFSFIVFSGTKQKRNPVLMCKSFETEKKRKENADSSKNIESLWISLWTHHFLIFFCRFLEKQTQQDFSACLFSCLGHQVNNNNKSRD